MTKSPPPRHTEQSDQQLAIGRAIAWAKIAANNLESGRKVLAAQGWTDDVNPLCHAITETVDVIRELENQSRRLGL